MCLVCQNTGTINGRVVHMTSKHPTYREPTATALNEYIEVMDGCVPCPYCNRDSYGRILEIIVEGVIMAEIPEPKRND